MKEYVLALLLAAAATYLLTPLVRRGAIATRAMHAARTRDVHVVPTPLLGGLAMYAGLAAGLLVADQLTYLREAFPSPRTVPGLLLAGAVLVVTGIIDDRWGMGAISKLAAQVRERVYDKFCPLELGHQLFDVLYCLVCDPLVIPNLYA